MDKIYIVTCLMHLGGTSIIFATADEEMAKQYIEKFNRILKKWKWYYDDIVISGSGSDSEKFYDRWYALSVIIKCYYVEVPVR